MRKGLFIMSALLITFLFTGGVLAYLGAQEEEINQKLYPPQGSGVFIPAGVFVPAGGEEKKSFPIKQKVLTAAGITYALSRENGVLISFDGETWLERNEGLPRKVVYPFDVDRVRGLTAIGVDPLHEGRIAVTTVSNLYLSENYGAFWEEIPLGKPLRPSSYLTSVALSPSERNTVLLGTSFNGFFETRDRGKSWQDPSRSADFLYRGAGFYEEISGIAYHPLIPEAIIFSSGFGHGIYIGSGDRASWSRLYFPGKIIQRLQVKQANGDWLLEAETISSLWHYSFRNNKWRLPNSHPSPAGTKTHPPGMKTHAGERQEIDPFRRERIRKASGKYGIYVNSYRADGKELDDHLAFLARHGLNAMVVDFKDDFGRLTFNTNLELPYRVGAVDKRFELEELIEKAHAHGIYVVARIVVFKDRQLYNYENYKYAAWNMKRGGPWRYLVRIENETPAENRDPGENEKTGANEKREEKEPVDEVRYVQNEYWVDPFNPFVWKYNLDLAGELQARGVDEIQFDYIRFPSDGNLSEISYRYKKQGMTRIDALESFLRLARESIHIPISTDLYGFNSWHRMGNWIGQSIEMLADYVDVICPMFYPSHFPGEFIDNMTYLERAKQIYREGTTRAASIVGSRSIIRPYVQAFLIGGELKMSDSEYTSYLVNQIEGTLEAPSSGFTLWNASNRYYMVKVPLKTFLSP